MTADELYELVLDDITSALKQPDHSMRMTELRAAGDTIFRLAYEELPGDPKGVDQASIDFLNVLNRAMAETVPSGEDGQAERIARIWATAAANAAVYYSKPNADKRVGPMEHDRVRDAHVPMHGTTVTAGQSFTVGGVPMRYPGEPVGPPELWIGCRCSLQTSLTAAADDDALVARTFTTEQRRKMADKGTAMPDGSFPIANVEDLRNAIQAIGRAKDPDKARRHIRKRAKALGAENLIPESWTASVETDEALTAWGPSTSPPGTHDAPGWLTHPRETQRLRTYWTRGAGAAKIRWGTPNDLTRCAKHLRKYVAPNHVWGTCQNMHKEALGYYNPESRGRRGGGDPDEIIDAIDAAFAAAAEEDTMDTPTMLAPPLEWFQNPGFDAPTPLTITSDGRVLGHLASWDTCHVGISGECVTPPKSNTNYAHFRTGEVETREGELVAVGQITMDTGHAGKDDGPQVAVAHYDDTGTGVADVSVGEDDHGIWVAGAMRPGVSEQQMYALKATGALSGDWRRIGGTLELVAALAVNVPGFPIPRVAVAAAGARTYSLVAAAVVVTDPGAVDADRVAIAVLARLDQREADAQRQVRAASLINDIRALRVDALATVSS
jgi:hypothetical protein